MLVRFTDVNDAGSPVFMRSENIEAFYASSEADGTTIVSKHVAVVVVKESPDEVAAALKEFTSMNAQKSLVLNGESQRLVDYVDGLPNKDDVLKYLIAQTQVALKECSKPSHRDYLG